MTTATIPFIKMHGLGNDFVIIDARKQAWPLTPQLISTLAHRRRGVGCDQVIVITPAADADSFMKIYNADGSEVAACGNASRCVAQLLLDENDAECCTIRTHAGLLHAYRGNSDAIVVDMGIARRGWQEIPLAYAADTNAVDCGVAGLPLAVAVNMGNPHAVFFVEDVNTVAVASLGAQLETHPLFPERANIEFAQVISRNAIIMRVWERGVGITDACGTGACAVAVAAHARGLCGQQITVQLDGGILKITLRDDGHVFMAGEAVAVFNGNYRLSD